MPSANENNTQFEHAETRMKQAELRAEKAEARIEALQASELNYRRLFETATDGLLILDCDTGRINDVNPFLVELLGFSRAELVGKAAGESRPFKDILANQSILEQLQKAGHVRHDELPLETRDGRRIAVEFVGNVFQAGDKKMIRCNFRDIKERKRAEEAMQQMHYCVEHAGDGIFWITPEGRLIYVNESACRRLGYSKSELLSMNIFDLDPDFRPDAWGAHCEKLKRLGSMTFETRHRTKDGEIFPVEVNANSVRIGGQELNFAFTRDITEHKREEEQKAFNNVILRTQQEISPDAILVVDEHARIISFNRRFVEMWGLPADLVASRDDEPVLRLVTSQVANPEAFLARVRYLYEHKTEKCHTEILLKDGRVFERHSAPMLSPEGRYYGRVWFFRDISERKKVELALRESEAFLNTVVENIPHMIFVKDAKELRYEKFNKAGQELLGYSLQELVGKNDYDFFPKELADAFTEKDRQVLRGKAVVDIPDETVQTRHHGERILHTKKIPVFDNAGQPLYLLGISEDITEKKQMEASLNRERELWQALLDASPDHIYFKDKQSRFIKSSKAQAFKFGVESTEGMLGKTDFDFFDELHARPAYEDEQEIIRSGRPVIAKEEREVWNDGHVTWASSSKFPMRDAAEKIIGIIGISRDITEQKRMSIALRENEEKFSKIFHSSPVPVSLSTVEEGRYLDVNAEFLKMFGWSREEMIGHTAFELNVWPNLKDRAAIVGTFEKSDSVRNFELDVRTKTGEIRRILWSVETVVIGGEKCFLGTSLDITERQRIEQAMRESEERYLALFDRSLDCVFLTDFNGNILDANQAALNLFGYRREDILSLTFASLLTEDQLPLAFKVTEEIKSTGRQKHPVEFRVRCKDGRQVYVEIQASLINREGKPYAIQGIARDLTERKRAEASLARLATAVEQSTETIVITDTNGIILYSNPAFEKSTGYTRAEVHGQNPRILKSGKQNVEFYRKMWETLKRGEVWSGHFYNRRKDGTLYEEEATISPLRDAAGKIVNYVAVKRDVTREVQLEAQFRHAQKMDAIGTLAGGVAHDFNNILAIIQMQAGLLKSVGELSPDQAKFVDEISLTVERAAALTRQLLLFSRREAPQSNDLDLNKSITIITNMLRRILGENISFQLKLAAQPMFVHADAGMMDQVLLNLSVNARDAMPKGGQLIITTSGVEFDEATALQSAQARPGSFVCLSVADTGCGIPPEILPRIFEPFFTTKSVGKGTGLGLATVFGIVQQHKGWINVYSEVGHGTTFKIYLPRLAEMTDIKIAQKKLATVPAGKETILLVDDEQSLRVSMKMTLTRLGYHILEAPTGAKAIEVWKEHREAINLLLTDLMMPEGMSGKELAIRLLHDNPKLKVIYMSGYSAEIAGKDFPLQEGVNFLAKPFETHKLAQTVRKILDKSS